MSTPTLRGFAGTFTGLGRTFAVVAGLALVACSREPDLDEVFPPPRPIAPADSPERPPALRYEFSAGSEVQFRLGPRSGRVRGRMHLASGGLSVDAFDLTLTRGHATIDLRTIEVENDGAAGTASGEEPDATMAGSLTERALTWLQVAGEAAPPEYRYARFSLRSIGGLSAVNAFEGERVRSETGRTRRRVGLDASGELELHGVRFPYTARLDVTFEWGDAGTSARQPSRIEIATREAVNVDLGTHGILPRRSSGEVDTEALAELRKASGPSSWVTARWVAVPAAVSATAVR